MKHFSSILFMLLVSCFTAIGQTITGTGTVNNVSKFITTSTIGPSIIYDNGTNVGIGTAAPSSKLTVVGGDIETSGYMKLNYALNSGGGFLGSSNGTLLFQMGANAQARYGGTLGTISGSQFFIYNFQEAWGGAYNYYWGFNNTGDNYWGSTNTSYSVKVQQPRPANVPLSILGAPGQTANLLNVSSSGGSVGGVLSVLPGGNVGIGNLAPLAKLDVTGNVYCRNTIFIGTPDAATPTQITGYALAVNGTAIFNKAKVKIYGNWPDYVFDPNYKLLPITELETYLLRNKHLPDIPSATEVEKNGIDLGENQTLLLKKIEELTIYVINLSKKVETLSKENKRLMKNRQLKK